MMIITSVFIVAAYLLGSISSAVIICRILGYPDPRTLGSGNPGATNVMRIGGKRAALMTLCCDALKGLAPVLAAKAAGVPQAGVGWIGLAAVVGHTFPVFFKFQGGKGVATTLGVAHGWHLPSALIIDLIWLTLAKVFKVSSIAGITSLICLPIILAIGQTQYWQPATFLALLSLYRHKANIIKLMAGKESQLGESVGEPHKTEEN